MASVENPVREMKSASVPKSAVGFPGAVSKKPNCFVLRPDDAFNNSLKQFPGAVPYSKLQTLITECVLEMKIDPKKCVCVTSQCTDMTCADDNTIWDNTWGYMYHMGGLGGIPMVGKTGFWTYLNRVPADGALVIICGSHIGLDVDGFLGALTSGGQSDVCQTSIAAFKFCEENHRQISKIIERNRKIYAAFDEPADAQACQVLQVRMSP